MLTQMPDYPPTRKRRLVGYIVKSSVWQNMRGVLSNRRNQLSANIDTRLFATREHEARGCLNRLFKTTA